jgi:hypothetical protein
VCVTSTVLIARLISKQKQNSFRILSKIDFKKIDLHGRVAELSSVKSSRISCSYIHLSEEELLREISLSKSKQDSIFEKYKNIGEVMCEVPVDPYHLEERSKILEEIEYVTDH